VAGRRSVWSDPRLIEAAESFVPAADEVWRLQRGKDADCLFFQRMVNGGRPITDGGTRQGIWVCSPAGILLSRVNSNRADVVLRTLEEGLAAWGELDEAERRLPEGVALDPGHRWESSEPKDGLVLERLVRELPLPSPEPVDAATARPGSWNRDFAWFSRAEVARLVAPDVAEGDTFELPSFFARRLARFHLVDNARGQTLPYADEELREARLEARVVGRRGAIVELELEGATHAVAEGPWLLGDNLWKPKTEHAHGIRTRLAGRARLDLDEQTFESFELIALASRWGRTTFNGRGRDDSPGLLGFSLSLAGEPRIAPTFVAVYDGDWIVHPPQ